MLLVIGVCFGAAFTLCECRQYFGISSQNLLSGKELVTRLAVYSPSVRVVPVSCLLLKTFDGRPFFKINASNWKIIDTK